MIFLRLNPRGQSARDEWRNVVKKIRETLASLMTVRRGRAVRWLKPALVLALGLAAGLAGAQPANDNFASAFVIRGISGSTNGDNALATLEPCETNAVSTSLFPGDYITNSVWFAWTAPGTGFLQLDTDGSAFETVLAVWTTASGLCDSSLTNLISDDDGQGTFSQVDFPVAAGKTYYISVNSWDDGSAPFDNAGAYVLNWNATIPTIPTGQLKFTSKLYLVSENDSSGPNVLDGTTVNPSVIGARVTVTRPAPAYGRVLVDYQVSDLTYTNFLSTNYYGISITYGYEDTNQNLFVTNYIYGTVVTSNSYQYYNSGYQYVPFTLATTNYTEFDNGTEVVHFSAPDVVPTDAPPLNYTTNLVYFPGGFSNTVVNADGSISITISNFFQLPSAVVTQLVTSVSGIRTNSQTLIFDNFQMSQDIIVPVNQSVGPDSPMVSGIPSYAALTLSNPRLDPQENANLLIAPKLDPVNSVSFISALNPTFTTGSGVFNLERSTFRVDKDVSGSNAVISVYRSGGNFTEAVSVQYFIDPTPGDLAPNYGGAAPPPTYANGYIPADTFPLQAGSDYATPSSDYTPVTGTLNWGAYDGAPKTITIPIINNGLVENNMDLLIQLYNPLPVPTTSDPGMELGQINAANLTILFDDTDGGQQPAGALDRTWNQDNVSGSIPPYLPYPGTAGGGGTVYAVAEQPDGSAIIAGSFISFDSNPYNRIVRVMTNGFQDPTFLVAPNSGANDFIAALALQPNGQIIIGGNFTAFNGFDRHYIARLNPDGSLDTSFNPGLGANGKVWSVVLESSGQIIIGGEFTTYNGTNVNEVARLNADGSLDTTFNPGAGPDGIVDAVAVDASGRVIIGGGFANVSGVSSGGVARLNVDGSLDTAFAPGIGTFNPETLTTDPVKAVAVQPDGKILIGGSFSYLDLVNYNGLARLSQDGTVDLSFQPGTGTLNPVTGVADTIYSILLQPDGNILIGGDLTAYNQTRRIGVARLFQDGTVDTSFMDTAYNQFAGVPTQYLNQDAVGITYPFVNTRNVIYALALESGGNVIIGGTFPLVGGGYTRDDIHFRSNVARLIGGATPGPGNLEFSYSNYSVNNSDGQLYVSLVRTNGNLGPVSVTFSTNTAAPGPGIASGADFSLSPIYTNPTWVSAWTQQAWMYEVAEYGPNYNSVPALTPRSTSADVYVNVFNPGNISGNLSANFALSNPSGNFSLGGEYIALGAALGARAAAPLTIIDSNIKPGVLSFSAPVYSVIENGGSATITLTRTNGTDGIVSVWYATSNGTATNGIDYTGATNQVVLGVGVTNATFTVPTRSHYTSIQPDKTVNLRLFTPSGGATLGQTNAVLTLINPNYAPGHASFSLANYSVNENAGSAIITVNRLGGSTGTMGVTLLTSGGSAVNGVNYLGATNVLYWASGDATTRTVSVPVKDDGVVTPNLVVYLQLTNSQVNGTNNPGPLSFGSLASPTNATLTIVNVDSAGSVQFSSPVYSVKKYGGFALIPVTRVNGSIGPVTVDYTTMDGTAADGVNYTGTNGTLSFATGEVSKFITVPIIENNQSNGPLALNLILYGAFPANALGAISNAVLNIIDSDSVNEPPGSPDPTFGAFGFNNTVYALALQTNNQLLVGGDFTMADGVTRNRIARLNADGTLDAGFSLPSSAMGADGSVRTIAVQADGRILIGGFFTNINSVARGHIARINPDGTLDNLFNPGSGADNPVYALTQTSVGGQSKVLLGGAFATISGTTFNGIARLNADGTPDSTFNLGGLGANATVYALAVQSDGKIVIGGNFTAVNGVASFNHIARLNVDGSADTSFNAAASGASDSVRAIALQLDGRILIGGVFTNVNGVALNHVARLNADGSVDASFNPGLGANDAVFSISLQSDNRIVLGGEFTTCSGVTRNRITRLNPDGTVDPTINFGTGANDFVAATVIQDDTIAGYPANIPDEKIIIGGGFTQYDNQPEPHVVRIFGGSIGGSGAFQFSSANYQVDENGTNVVITVLRTGGTANAPAAGDIFVTAATSDGSAVAGINYSNVVAPLDFPLGEVLKTFTIPVIDDQVVTTNLTVNLAISSPTPPAQIGNQPTAVLTIINVDTTVSFSSATYSVPKNIVSGTAAINIVRQGSTIGTATVNFTTTTSGTAVPVADYTPVSQTVIFNPGISNVTVYIPINNNGLPEGNRTVTMQLANANGTTPASPTNATLTIVDTVNAPGQLTFAAPGYTITEGGGVGYTNAYITVIRANGSSGTVSVNFNTQDGTAMAGTKYIATSGVLTFGDGETSKTFFVPVINTPTAEGPESLSVVLSNPTGGATLAVPASTTLTILNTNTGIAFVSAANAFTEPSGFVPGSVVLNVIRFNNTSGTTTVSYSTTNGTAMAGTNYIGVTNAVLTFNPGDSVESIVISTLHDPRVTGDLFFTVGLASPSGSAQLTSPSYTVVTDHDADAGISFITNATSVYRNAGYVIIPVVCSNTNAEPLSVNYSTGGGMALPGTDYTATSGTLAFTNGIAVNYFYVLIPPNNQAQSNRFFNVTLSSPTVPGVLQPPSTETVTIVGTNTPFGLSFLTPVVLNGEWGSTNVDNTGGGPEIGDPAIAGEPAFSPVWFQWTAPADGEVSLDTIGSHNTNGTPLDTLLAVYTGNNLSALGQVAANDEIYPIILEGAVYGQYNIDAQNVFNTNSSGFNNFFGFGSGSVSYVEQEYFQPYGGPSGLRFNAKAHTTYYIEADTKATPYSLYSSMLGGINGGSTKPIIPTTGPISLSWAYHPSGVLRFATEKIDLTGNMTNADGSPMILYECAETEAYAYRGYDRPQGSVNADQYDTTIHSYYDYDAPGLLVTVTRVGGSSGRIAVDYTTVDGNTNLIANGDIPAGGTYTNTQIYQFGPNNFYTNTSISSDYTPVSGTLVFDDYEMSKTILIPITDDGGLARPNRDFTVVLSNPRVDPTESASVSAPRVDPQFGQAMCRILDVDIDPKGPTSSEVIMTNSLFGSVTNTVITLIPTNPIFNFPKKSYRVGRDAQTAYWGGVPVTIYVDRMGTNTAGVTLAYRIDNEALDKYSIDDFNNEFPLKAGSDYAVPFAANPPKDGAVFGPTNFDFQGIDGESGTLTFPSGNDAFIPQPIHFTIFNNRLTEFNKDIHVGLYQLDSNGNPIQDGMVAEADLTILFDDAAPPAGSVDEYYNADFGVDLALATNTLGSAIAHPGTEALSEVYSVAVTTNNQTVIGGAFSTYTDGNNTHTVNGLARLNTDGSLDTTFNSGSGINVFPGGELIRSVALSGSQIVIGGDFSSYNGIQRNCVARVNANGSLDTTFATGAGANGAVWSVLVQTDGKVLIGGEFTTYNSAVANHIARLNTDGSLDTTFNPSNIITGPVYAMTLPGLPPFSFSHASSGTTNEDDQVLNLDLRTAGIMFVNYNLISVPDDMQIYYGNTNVAAGTGVLLYDTGSVTNLGTGFFALPFGPTNGFATNIITIVMNPGGTTNAIPVLWSYNVFIPGQNGLMIGGHFNVAGQSYANIALLNPDGSLNPSFSPSTGPDGSVLSLAWQPDNRIVAGGLFKNVSGVGFNNLTRLNADGSIDANFYIGTGSDNAVNSLTLQPVSGLIYVGGSFTSMNGTHRLGFARLNADGTVDTSFLDTAYNQLAGLPRIRFIDPPGTVYSSGLQSDGNVIIGGSFAQVGGGQFDANVRPSDYSVINPATGYPAIDPDFNTNLNVNVWPEPKVRDGVRNRGNIARLVGGATPGPGNVGMAATSYAANKTQSYEAVTLVRTNGNLGYATANFSVLPGLAQNGLDYAYNGAAPFYPIEWEYSGPTRLHSDGLYGANGLMTDNYDRFEKYGFTGPAAVNVSIINDTSSSGNLSAQFVMANPGADMFYLGGQLIPMGVALGESVAPLTVVDNLHQDGVFGFASPSYVATNAIVSVVLTRTNGTFGTVQMNYQTTTNGSTAVLNADYRATNGVVTFTPGQTSNAFPVTILNNSYISSLEKTVNVQLYNVQDLSSGNASLGLTNAVVRIINPNYQGYLNLSTNAYYAKLSAGAIKFTVTRTVGGQGTLTLQYGTANGTALNGVDYLGATNSLTWNSGDVSPRTVAIPLINNNLVGPNKQFAVNIFNAALNGTNLPSLLGSITNAVMAIVNDNSYGTFQFSSPGYQVNENGGYATINVTRSGSALGTAAVSYATADGTAFAGTNYVATNGTLSFLPGQVSQSFNVGLLDDGKTNPPPASFYFAVALSSPSAGSSLGSPTNSLVHMVDAESYNEPPGSLDTSFDPSAGMNASVLGLALQSNGQIVAGGSFKVVNGASMNRIARLNTDGTLDAAFLNGLAGADGSVNAVVSQTDDRIVVGGSFANIDSIVRQRIARLMTDGSLDTSFNPSSGADSTVFALAETFVNGARGLYVGGAFSTFNGVSSPGIVRLNNDGSVDGTFATGQGANGTVYAVAAYPTNSVYNAGKVLVGGLFTNFNGSAVGNLARLNPDGSLDASFSQNVSANNAVRAIAIQLDGGVLIGGDFTNVNGVAASHIARLNNDGTLDTAFSAAVTSGVNGTVNTIEVQADNRIMVAGQFTSANGVTRHNLTRLLPTGAVDPTINFGDGANGAVNALVIQPADGLMVIGGDFTQYNDQPRDHIARIYGGSMAGSGAFQFSSASYQIDETGGFATVLVERTGGTSGTNADGSGVVQVTFDTTDGTAVAGTNYSAVNNFVLNFPVGEVLQTVYVPVMDDMVITTNLTVNLQLSNPTPGTGLGNQANAVLTIINDDSVLQFLSATYTVPKDTVNGVATIDIIRLGSTSGSCTVDFATGTNGTAVIGTDYYPTNLLITFNPGDTTNSIQIPVINNPLPEGNRTVTMALTNALNSAKDVFLSSPSNAVLTIIDTVQAPGQLFFAATNFAANSSDGVATLTVLRTNGASGSVSATYATVPGTALPGFNYVATTNTVTFNDGETKKTCTFPLINNLLAQGPVSLSVSLSNPTGGAGLVAPTNTTVTIYKTNAVVGFTLATNNVPETAGPASIVVQRFNNTNIVSTVYYATTNGTAMAGVNYSNTFGTLTFGLGESLKSIAIPLIVQSNVTDLAFSVNLSSPVNAQLIAPSNTVVILQAAAAGVSFNTNTMSVFKNAGSALITVVCSNPRVEPVVVNSNTVPLQVKYTTVDGTARAGINYQPVSGTLVFTNGNGTNTFVVPIFNNNLVSSNLTFTVALTNVTAPGRITPYGAESVVIAESNAGLSFSQAGYSVFKNGVSALINVYRTGYTDSVVSVDYLATNGTALAGQNFYPTNGTLVFTNGVTSQSFNVPIIANSQVQGNLFALLLLSNPTNAQVVDPGAATLTIVETGGGYVIPAGSLLLANSSPFDMASDVIGSNDTVTVLFAFRDAAGLNVTNLVAYLLATNGVAAPSPASQTYGPLTVYGHSVSRPFSFTAHGTNTLPIAPTFQLYDNGKFIGPATFTYTMGTWTTTFANTNPIIINDNAAASPYPSVINVSGLGNTLIKATVTMTNVTHTKPSDIDALVVSPTTNTLIMAHAGGANIIKHVTLTFDDAATNSLPQNGQIVTGTNKPTQYYPVKNFP